MFLLANFYYLYNNPQASKKSIVLSNYFLHLINSKRIIWNMEKLTYSDIKNMLNNLRKYNIDSFIVGYSFLGEPIYGFHVGTYKGKQILVEAGIHAREYISTLATIEEIKNLANIQNSLSFGTYLIPLVNPDGVRLVLEGTSFIQQNNLKSYLLKLNGFSENFSLWKSNILGVDLNTNFNAMWGLGAHNITHPAPAHFIGHFPNSEIETLNLVRFLSTHSIDASLSIHTKGEVVFYGYDGLSSAELARDKFIATHLATYLGFTPEKTVSSVGGFSDYVSETCHVPAFTIELGNENHCHPITSLHLNSVLNSFLGITQEFSKFI